MSDDEKVPVHGDKPMWRWFADGPLPTASDGGVVDVGPMPGRVVWRDEPEFLQTSEDEFNRVSSIETIERVPASPTREAHVLLWETSIATVALECDAPYFAAWLDRLGIPWTDDLRKAHEAGKGEA